MTREEVIKTLEGMDEFKHVCDKDNEFEAIRFAIKALKEERHGEWKYHEDWELKYVCNLCGSLNNIRSPFCPTCGARMKKEGD